MTRRPAGNSFDSMVLPASRALRLDPAAERRTLRDQRIDALAREPLGELDGRLHREHRPRGMVDDIADPIVARLGVVRRNESLSAEIEVVERIDRDAAHGHACHRLDIYDPPAPALSRSPVLDRAHARDLP